MINARISVISYKILMKEYSDVSYRYEAAVIPIGQSLATLTYFVLALSILLVANEWLIEVITPTTSIVLVMMPLFRTKLSSTLYVALASYRNFMISKNKINRIFDEEEEDNKQNISRVKNHEIKFQNVQFSYEKDESVLKDV